MKAVVAAFNQEKALVGAFSVIANLRMELFEALLCILYCFSLRPRLAPPHPALPAAGLRARLPGQGEAAQRLRAGDGAHRGSLPTHLPACQNIRCARHP